MKLVKLLTIACIAIAMVVLIGCSSGGGSSLTTLVKGVVRDSTTNNPLVGVVVSAGAITDTTDVNGMFSLAVAPGSSIKIKAEKVGYVGVVDFCGVSDGGTAEVDFNLDSIGYEKNMTAMLTTLNTAVDPRGTEVKLPAASIVDSNNNPVDSAKIEITTSIANDTNYAENFPGLFIGSQTGQPDKPIESFGFITVEISNSGQDCKLGAGKTADIAIPVGTGAADPGSATIDLWSLDEDTGKWKFEGQATRDASSNPVVYRATVTHFSTYNLDRPISSAIPLTITVKNGTTPVAGASVVAKTTIAPIWEGRGITGADGTYRFASVPPGTNSIFASFGTLKGSVYSYDIVGGEASATITLIQYTSKEVSFYYMNGATKVKANGATVSCFSEGAGAHTFFNGLTDADGKVTLSLIPNANMYMVSGEITVGATKYSILQQQYNSIAAIPAEIQLTAGTPGP